jgi:hypothetical protein
MSWRSIGDGGLAPSLLNLCTTWRRMFSFTSLPLYIPYPLNRRLGEPQRRSRRGTEDKNLLFRLGFDVLFLYCSYRNQSLYRLNRTGLKYNEITSREKNAWSLELRSSRDWYNLCGSDFSRNPDHTCCKREDRCFLYVLNLIEYSNHIYYKVEYCTKT